MGKQEVMSTSVPVKKALSALLRDPGNTHCADCKAQLHPRWASWSLGVFICIKCAGIHRSLGTHISKVKSVDLDTWKEEHLTKLIQFKNNSRANSYYEANLADDLKRRKITDTSSLQNFIKNKYEYKKWIGDLSSIVNGSGDATLHKSSTNQSSVSNASLNSSSNSLQRTQTQPSPSLLKTSQSNTSLLNLQVSSLSKTTSNTSDASDTTSIAATSNKACHRANEIGQRSDLKKSILSLYSKPSTQTQSQSSFFNTTIPQPSPTPTPSPLVSPGIIGTGNNNANSNSNSNVSLDDNELFKNVWT